jgi:hypothetical protein
MAADLCEAIERVGAQWAKTKKSEERRPAYISYRRERMTRERRMQVKEAAQQVMEEAYLKASANGTLPANARQIMYAARGKIQEMTGRMLGDQYFTQTLLPDYLEEHQPDWDIAYDARGNFTEPHTEHEVALGTLGVQGYLDDVKEALFEEGKLRTARIKTLGPDLNFGALMYVEKEGFDQLWRRVRLAERFDIGIFSSKGISSTSARKLADVICGEYDIPLLVLHDCDLAGFTILNTLRTDNRRYQFEYAINVVDLGLRLADARQMGLQDEAAAESKSSPAVRRKQLLKNGATPEEAEFLLTKRFELNAMTSDQLVAFVERKLAEHGIKKVIPVLEKLEKAYRLFERDIRINKLFERVQKKIAASAEEITVPDDLESRVTEMLGAEPKLRWDAAVRRIQRNEAAHPRTDETSRREIPAEQKNKPSG